MNRERPTCTSAVGLVFLGAAVGVVFLLVLGGMSGPTVAAGAHAQGSIASPFIASGPAASVRDLSSEPTEAVAGTPVTVGWEAFTSSGDPATGFAVGCGVTISEGNGSMASAWVNSSATGALPRPANGTFQVAAADWNAGVLRLSVDLAAAAPVTVQLLGTSLPSTPAPVALSALPDLAHLAISHPLSSSSTQNGTYRSSTLWQVRDRFGDPAPGATLLVELAAGPGTSQTFVPVVWSTGGVTVAWVNYSVAAGTEGTVTVRDAAGAALFGPAALPGPASAPASSSSNLSPLALTVVALLGVGGFAGMGVLLSGGRRASGAGAEGEAELRKLAEGRAAVVEIVREGGPLMLHQIEARWEPPPAPPAVADWVASLVTDGTLTATLEEGGRARFALAERTDGPARVTLDEDELERGIARRDAAVEGTDEEGER